jgi:uncharacterized NAD(P)/FAD-binding protein YdhS
VTRSERPDDASEGPAPRPGPHVLIIGGGASGVLMATQLLSRPEKSFRVTIVEGQHTLGCGVAYSTRDPDHLLNTRVQNMSAWPDQPDHFLNWLRTKPQTRTLDGQSFVGRETYGAYLASLLAPWTGAEGARRLRCVQQTCVGISETPNGVTALLEDGQSLIGDTLVIATGHVLPEPDPCGLILGPWQDPGPIEPTQRVVIIGTGLSMVDQALSLLKSGHRGEIVALSRRGLLPRTHTTTNPVRLTLADIPRFVPTSVLLHWLRGLVAKTETAGGNWRDVIDGIRPFVRTIWRALPPVERARFLRHGATWWDVHRHRIPPASAEVIRLAQMRGQLVIRRAAFLGASAGPDNTRVVKVRAVQSDQIDHIPAGLVIDCRGIRRDPEHNAAPLVKNLLTRGMARVDLMRLGLDVSVDCRLINQTGEASARIRVIGPASRAAFWEITSIPDIRDQVAVLASKLTTPTRLGAD